GTIVYSNELNITESLPVANFTATPTTGTAPLVVQFTDTSTNLPTNWNWSFGDGTFSTAQNTSHTFTPGIFSISLNATNTQGSNISTRTAYIHSNFASPVMFRNTENRTGVYSDGGTRPGNSLKWNFTAGGDVHSSPVISGGVLYVGSSDGRLYALNASTGLEQWRYSFGAEVFSSPAVANGVVFVGTNDNNLYALNATTGAKIWNFTTGNHIIGSPALADGTVYIGSADNTLYALNPTTGEKLWDTAPGLYLDSSPAVSNGSVFIGSWDYRVYAFNATTGSGLWDYTTGNAIDSSPAVENHTVFIGSDDHNLYALNAMTGAKIWNFTTGGYIYSSPAVSGGVVYVGSDDKNVYALDAVTGAKLWNFSALNAIRSSPAIANGVLYVGSHDGRLYALNATTGEKLWDYLTEEWTWVESSPAVSGGVVYFGGDTDKVYALHQIQPMANFTANVTSGTVQLSVRFTDTSTGSPSAWYWSFGDLVLDNISTLQHPVHTYGTTGNFTVSLNVTSSAGSNVTIKTGYITVSSPRTTGPVHNLNSGMNYTGIQLAVENATAFDTILVDSGQYPETVNITRPLMLRGNETGTGPPVIDPGTPGVNTAITLSADNITLDGFVARNARAGVHITGSNATLRNITATQNDVGISLDSSRRNRITRAEVYNNTNDGITLVGSSDTTIDRSWVHANSGTGITWVKSANITFTDNVIDFNRAYGLYLKNSEGNTVSGNNLSTNDYGIALEHVKTSTFSHNFAGNNSGKGIYLDDTTGCVFTQNDAPQNGDVGINLFNTSRFNAFTENRAMHNVNKGFYLDASYNNTFTRDNASFNSYGFSLYTSNNNTFSGINSTYQQSGMSLANSSGNIVTGGNILWNTLGGIGMEYAEENRFCGITLAGNNEGFFVGTLSNNNVFLSNTVVNSTNQGITLYQHAGSVLSGNVIRKGSTGLKMDTAVHSSVSNNEFVLNSDYGIIISTGGWNTFSANNASWNGIAGINIGDSTGNSFTGMKVDTNGYGVMHGDNSSNTTFSGNTVSNNSAYAFEIDRSSNVTIVDNTIRDNNRWYQGAIKFGESKNITVTRNWLENNNEAGIRIAANSTTGSINNNTISGHTLAGIMVEYATSHEIFNNTLSGNDYGFKLDTARFNTISHNRVEHNSHGAALVNSSGNVFFDNAFNNTINVQDDGNNTWNTTKQAVTSIIGKPYRGGNFWSNYTGVDTNGDGIGTTLLPYNNVGGIAFGGDWLPLTNVTGILPPVAGFAANVTSGTAPLAIQFNDTSTGSPTSWNWSFGDGAGSSLQNPVHTYIAPGTYPVSLNATNDGGSNLSVTVNYVTAYPPRPVPAFSVNVTTGTAPLAVGFTDASLNSPTGWAWFFGDETFTEPWTSVNASAGWTGRWHHTSVVTPDGSIVLMGGMSTQLMNDTWRSTDNGSTWVLVNASPGWAPRYGHSSVALPDGSIVLMGGYAGVSNYKNDVWRSTDKGSTWTLMNASAAWSVRRYFSSVAMPDGSILLTGGDYGVLMNDTWRSTDKGATWSLMNASSGWTQRAAHCSVAMTDSSIVVMGGSRAVSLLNDVWRSTDNGATWTLVNASAGWTPREGLGSVAIPDSSIVVLGGKDGTYSLRNDVWRSTDNGATWTQVNASARWTARYGHCSVVTPGSGVMVIGGQDASTYKNDVWRFTPTGSSLTNPSHIYTQTGNFTVTLQAYNDGGSNRTQRMDYIRVSAPVTNGTVHNLNTTLSYQTITDGINNATGGDTLLVDSGTYHEQVDVNKRLSLRGNNTGAGLPVIDIGSPGVNTAILISADNCSLDGFIAANSRDGVHITGSNATARNVTVTQNHFGISLESSSENTLDRVTAFNNTYAGITVSSSRNTTIRNSLVENNTGIGISLEGGSANTSVTGSLVRLNADYGIQVIDSEGSEVWDNDLGSNYYALIIVRSHDNSVIRNNASNSTENGIYLDSAVSNRLEENEVHDNRATGIVLVNRSRANTITANRVSRNAGPGIMAKENSSWNVLMNNRVSWNVGGAGGIYLETSGNNTISSSIIDTNREGIMLTASSNNNTLSFNRLTNNTYNGIALDRSNNNTLMNNGFTRNERGVHFSLSHNNTVLSSVVHNATQTGVGLADNSTANTITDTSVDGTGQFGIYLVWSHGNTITNLTTVSRDYGIFTEFARNNTIQESRISNSSTAGISLNASAGNLIADNYFNNTHNVQDNGNNTWNTTKQAATSIIGKPARGGNFWSNYAGVDTTGEGIGTTLLPYTNGGGIVFGGDWLPLTNVTGTLPPVANFTANVTAGIAPLVVQFMDNSTGVPTGWNWSFGDGSVSTVQHPVHTYLSGGTFSVSLNATNAGGSNVTTRTNYVTVKPPVPIPGFSANVTSGTAPLPVSFTDTASGSPTGWAWFFGDETFTQPWTQVNASAGWAARVYQSSAAMPDSSVILTGGWTHGGYTHDVWRSVDGGNVWSEQTASAGWSARDSHTSMAMPDGSIIVLGGEDTSGYKNDVWRSTDGGKVWTLMTLHAGWSPRIEHTSVAMPDGSILVMGGNTGTGFRNDVWRSTDNGATWIEQTSSAGWSARCGHTSVAMPDGSIVLLGGFSGGYVNDVWRSTDNGITWTQQTASAGWSARSDHASVAMPDGSILVMGGYLNRNDSWRSSDNGVTWTEMSASAGWVGRIALSSVAMPDGSVLVMCGDDGAGNYKNDVWRLVPTGSIVQNPTHTYTSPGTYQVTLQAYNAYEFNSTRKAGYIHVTGSSAPMANFTANVTAGIAPLAIQFMDNSTGAPTGWNWSFGDGSVSAVQHPVHTYLSSGTFSVSLNATNAGGSNVTTRMNYVTVTSSAPVANF
ncbi:MAG: NosD domain-containing protein, partial [Methanoregula sp.]|nr:NosD domain-containing protein [Methanoregula sp.]